MRTHPILPPVAVVPMILAALLDWWLTSIALPTGAFVEANPFARALYEGYGSLGLIGGKIAMVASMIVALIVGAEFADLRAVRLGLRLLVGVATLAQVAVSLHGLFALYG